MSGRRYEPPDREGSPIGFVRSNLTPRSPSTSNKRCFGHITLTEVRLRIISVAALS